MALIQMRTMGVYDSIFGSYIGGSGDYHFKPDSASGPVLRIATNAEFPPYEFRTENGPQGIDIEIARYIADFMERPLEIVDIDFDEIIAAVDSGKADIGLAALSVTEERERIVNFTDHYAKSKIVVMVRSGEEESTFQRIKDTLFGD
jgi:polar amino acid transport system substrate-binding protein